MSRVLEAEATRGLRHQGDAVTAAPKPARGRPPKPGGAAEMISMRLPPKVARALRAAAKRRGISQSAVVERALRRAGDDEAQRPEAAMNYIGTITVDGRELDVCISPTGALSAVGHDTEASDTVLVQQAAACGGHARRRVQALQDAARQAALAEGLLKCERVGSLGYTHEHHDVYTERWLGAPRYRHGPHLYEAHAVTDRVPVQGVGDETPCRTVELRLMPTHRTALGVRGR